MIVKILFFMSNDNQEVGLEAAILSRKRKSSLVELTITENVTELKSITEAVRVCIIYILGSRTFCIRRRYFVRNIGEIKSENADMSNENHVKNMIAE
jgi:hypothetical protein